MSVAKFKYDDTSVHTAVCGMNRLGTCAGVSSDSSLIQRARYERPPRRSNPPN
jgi:hypothetical protein